MTLCYPAVESRIAPYELAFRMQMAAPELLSSSEESPQTFAMCRIEKERARPYATHCLPARRMIERGVRLVLLAPASWDDKLKESRDITGHSAAALISDSKQRALLEDTPVISGGEFGRAPIVELRNTADQAKAGRDHHPLAYRKMAPAIYT